MISGGINGKSELRRQRWTYAIIALTVFGAASGNSLVRAMFIPGDVAAAVTQNPAALAALANSGFGNLAAPINRPAGLGTGNLLNGRTAPVGAAPATGNFVAPGPVGNQGVPGAGNPQVAGLAPQTAGTAPSVTGGSTPGAGSPGAAAPANFSTPGIGGTAPTGPDIVAGSNPTTPPTTTPTTPPTTTPTDPGTPTTPAEPLPEPETWAMMLAGMGIAGWVARRKQRQAAVARA